MALPALQTVKICRFKRIDEAMVRLGDVNLFVGPNNSGKTSFIQGVHFAVSLLQTITYHRKWAVASRSAAVSFGPSELIYVPTESIYSVSHGAALTQDKAISFHFDMEDEEDFSVSVYKGKNKNISIKLHHPWAAKAASDIQVPYSVFCPGLAGIPKNETLVSEGVLRRAVARGDANVVLRNVLYRLSKTTEWKKFQAAFAAIFPDVEIRVQFEESLAEYIEAFVTSSGQEVPIELAGTGMLQMAQILAYIFYFSPRVLILDEPDSHLHPNNQRAMCRMIIQLGAERNMQIIMASHSRHVLDVISKSGKVISASKGKFSVVDDEQELSVLMDLGALDLKERVMSDGLMSIILTEDSDLKPIYSVISASKIGEQTFEILSYGGCSKASSAALLIKFLKSARPKLSVYVHRDRDFMNDNDIEGWADQIKALNAKPITTLGLDVEAHFVDAAHLAALNPPLTEVDMASAIDKARKDILEEQQKKGVNRYIENERLHGRPKLDHGAIAIQIPKLVASEPARYMSGKEVLTRLRKNYRDAHGQNLNVFGPSPHVAFLVEL